MKMHLISFILMRLVHEFNLIYGQNLFLESMFNALKNNGVLVTYAAKGSVRRAMQAVGFVVERLEGPSRKTRNVKSHQASEDC